MKRCKVVIWASILAAGSFFAPAAAQAKSFQCPAPSPPQKVVRGFSFYDPQDDTRSRVDPKRRAYHDRLVAPFSKFQNTIAKLSDVEGASQAAARHCANSLILKWAEAGGLTKTPKGNRQPELTRQWFLSTVAFARFKMGPSPDPADNSRINAWLVELARLVDDYHRERGAGRRTNLHYWGLLSIGITAHVTEDERLWLVAEKMYNEALADVDHQGMLRAELKRGARAAKYHAFAAEALTAFTLVRMMRRCDFRPPPAMIRLNMLVERSVGSTADIERVAGIAQQRVPEQPWLRLWDWALTRPYAAPRLTGSSTRLGGRMATLGRRLASGYSACR